VILRAVHIVGPVHNAPSNYLRIQRPPVLLGFDPMVQLVHVADVADAIVLALGPDRRGIYNIVGAGELPLSAALAELGRKPRWIPHPLAKPFLGAAFALGLSSFPVAELDFIRYVCMVDGRRAAASWISREATACARRSGRRMIRCDAHRVDRREHAGGRDERAGCGASTPRGWRDQGTVRVPNGGFDARPLHVEAVRHRPALQRRDRDHVALRPHQDRRRRDLPDGRPAGRDLRAASAPSRGSRIDVSDRTNARPAGSAGSATPAAGMRRDAVPHRAATCTMIVLTTQYKLAS